MSSKEPFFDKDATGEGESGAGVVVDSEVAAYEAAQRLEEERRRHDARLLQHAQPIYDSLFKNNPYEVNAGLSRGNRKRIGHLHNVCLAYNQAADLEAMLGIMFRLSRLGFHADSEGKFVDLGSGVGCMAIAAVLAHNFHSAMGIEVLEDLHGAALGIQKRWKGYTAGLVAQAALEEEQADAEAKEAVQAKRSHGQKKSDILVHFKLGDCCYTDWADGDVVVCHATCFDDVSLARISERVRELKPGSFFIIVTKKLPDDALDFFQLLETGALALNWGQASVHYYRRNRVPSPSYIPNKIDYIAGIIARKALPVFDPNRARLIEEEL